MDLLDLLDGPLSVPLQAVMMGITLLIFTAIRKITGWNAWD